MARGEWLGPVAAAIFATQFLGCVNLPNDVAVKAKAAPPAVSNTVRCDCVVNTHDHTAACTDSQLCPGRSCPCPGMQMDLCLPPDLNGDITTDPAVRARLADPKFDFGAAVETFCADRARRILIDIGAVSQHGIICNGKPNQYLSLSVPALVNCHAVSVNGTATGPSTWHSLDCSFPCGQVECINGPSSERPNANCDGDNIYTYGGLHPEACRCNIVTPADACDGKASEPFCVPAQAPPPS